MPKGIEIRVPRTSPTSTDTRLIAAGANRSSRMINSRVPNPKAIDLGAPKSSPLLVPPPNHPAATLISDTPMMRMIVPVTNGGKNLISRPTIGATRIMNTPQAITEP